MIDGVHIADPDQLAMLLDEIALMSRLLDDLRTLSLSESGELKLERESVELSDVVDDALAPFREEARRSQRNLVAEVPQVASTPTRCGFERSSPTSLPMLSDTLGKASRSPQRGRRRRGESKSPMMVPGSHPSCGPERSSVLSRAATPRGPAWVCR